MRGVINLSLQKPEAQQRFLRHLFSKKGEEGFTLVELIVVIIIMAILSQIGMVSFNRYIRRTRAFAAETAIRNIKRECEMNRDLGMDPTFTPLTPSGYSIQPDNSNSCSGGSGSELVTAIPDNQGEYPSYFYNFADGTIGCSYSNSTDNLFPNCERLTAEEISQKEVATLVDSYIKAVKAHYQELGRYPSSAYDLSKFVSIKQCPVNWPDPDKCKTMTSTQPSGSSWLSPSGLYRIRIKGGYGYHTQVFAIPAGDNWGKGLAVLGCYNSQTGASKVESLGKYLTFDRGPGC